MGEPIRWSVSVDRETDAIADILQRTFSDFVGENRSGLVKFVFKRFHRMASNVAAQINVEQGINQANSSEEITTFNNDFPNSVEVAEQLGRPKPLTRTQPPGRGARQRAINGVSRRSVLGESVVRLARYTSFLSHSTRFSRRVA